MAHIYENQQRELSQLRAQNGELMHINNEWDKEYREQREAFRRYQEDAQAAQTENHAAIARLKENLAAAEEERDRMEDELVRYQRELHALREQLAVAESLKTSSGGGGGGGGGGGEIAALKEELSLLRQQVKAYEEDFEAEKRDKERLRDEKQSAAIRFEAEKTSLQLQLDRSQSDLVHFTSEANRLAQQLKLKSQYEEDRYREHLENKGFVPRSPSCLPPLDPYVEIDQNPPPPPAIFRPPAHRDAFSGDRHLGIAVPSGSIVPNGHANGQALANEFNRLSVNGAVSPVRRRSANVSPANTAGSSWRLVPRGVEKDEVYSAPAKIDSDGLSSDSSSSSAESDCAGGQPVAPPPPLASKGRHACPRCARRFQEKRAFQQHRDRCLA